MLVELNGTQFEVDFLDYDTTKQIEEEYEIVEARAKQLAEEEGSWAGMRQSELIKKGTQPIYDFFDHVLGEGASEKIFHGKINYRLALEMLGEFTRAKDNSADEISDIGKKYRPDRAQPASKSNHKKKRKKKHPNFESVK